MMKIWIMNDYDEYMMNESCAGKRPVQENVRDECAASKCFRPIYIYIYIVLSDR